MNRGIVDDLNIVVIEGTTRPQRQSMHAAKFVEHIGHGIDGIKVQLIDPGNFTLPGDGNDPEGKDPRYTAITAEADGFFIVSPEYNHSFPGSLKRLLDSELENYLHKPVALAGVSSGHWGGVRAVEALVSAVREMGLVATFTDAYFPSVQDLFDDNGQMKASQVEIYTKSVTAAYHELIWMAHALKHARNGERDCPPKPARGH